MTSGVAMRLRGARIAVGPNRAVEADLEVANGRIREVGLRRRRVARSVDVDLSGHLILPGLINAHDHLELDLFPRLGHGPYTSAAAWAEDIYRPGSSPIREHLAVPKDTRLWWGGLKNLLSGVTTVCHHNPYYGEFRREFPVEVVPRYGWIHSIAFGGDLQAAFLASPPDAPFIIHLAEGTDSGSAAEIDQLDRMGALHGRTVLVHGVGLTASGHALRRARGAALVWCPTSNQFVLGRTLSARDIRHSDRVLLGSDSALTSPGTLLDEIRYAHSAGVPPEWIYAMVTRCAAEVLGLRSGEGTLTSGAAANLIAVRWKGETPAEALVGLHLSSVEVVLVSGRTHLVSPAQAGRWPARSLSRMEWLQVGGLRRRVRAPVRRLLGTTGACLRDGFRLAGGRVAL